MWIAIGPFDGEVVGESSFQKSKLLKPNTSYTVGRKDRPLLVNNKKISHDHCDFVVGPHTVEDVSNPTQRPTLGLVNRNKKDKTLLILRNGKILTAYPSSNEALEEGDVITLVTGVMVTVKWVSVCVFTKTPRHFSLEDCAALGIKFVHNPDASASHYVTAEYSADMPSCASLLSLCHFVKPEWLQDLIRVGKLSRTDGQNAISSLEDCFVLPSESKYQPGFSESLEISLKKLSSWQPNEERINLFTDYRFICLQEKASTPVSDLRTTIQIGGGASETFDIHSGVQKFRRAITRSQSKEGKQTVVIGDMEALQAAIGEDEWVLLSAEAQNCGLKIHTPSDIVLSVLKIDTESLRATNLAHISASNSSSLLPSVVSESPPQVHTTEPLPDESQTSRRSGLVRRAASKPSSRDSSVQPPPPMETNSALPLRKNLTRRAQAKQIITGIDDPSAVIDAVPDLTDARKTPPPQVMDLTAPTPARSRLKRRLGAPKESTQASLSGIPETVREPPLKKFKALFDATNQEGSECQIDSIHSEETSTQTQDMDTQTHVTQSIRSMGQSTLAILREEEEESQPTESHPRGSKRRLSSEDIVQQITKDTRATTVEPVNKRRAIENVNSVEPTSSDLSQAKTFVKPSSTITDKPRTGAIAGQPDRDPDFLKAIASTKRGKKQEDEFDREFNKLKISKPELNQQDAEEEWNVLEDFGDDSGLRGNFMVIMEMDVYKTESMRPKKVYNTQWSGKPNFKKFKKKFIPGRTHTIDLIVSEQDDYGMGTNYGKSGTMQSQNPVQADSQESHALPKKRATKKQSVVEFDNEDEEEKILPPRRASSRKPPSRASSAAPAISKKSDKSKATSKGKALFLDSDDDIQEIEEPPALVLEHQSEETLKSSPEEKKPPSRRTTRTTTKKPDRRRKRRFWEL